MMIYFPDNTGQRYYASHYRFFFKLLKFLNLDIELYNPEPRTDNSFIIRIKRKHILIDYSDHLMLAAEVNNFDGYFKYHYSKECHSSFKNVYPLTPISFHEWNDYFGLEKFISYKCNTDRILNNQKAGATAKARRTKVREMLKDKYGNLLDIEITDRKVFWMKINACLVSICVPGAREEILDRGQFQYMAFGACTISPSLDITLPFWRRPQAGIHYLACSPDYSDLIDVIEYCRANRGRCRTIGQRAKELFLSTSTPDKIWKWINQHLGEN